MNALKFNILILGVVFYNSVISQNIEFAKANKYYQNNEFSEAIKIYDSLYRADLVSFELLYNLGNSYFKSEDYTHAILFWERAKLINPTNDDLLHNLKIANSRIADQIDPVPEFFLAKVWHSVINFFSDKQWTFLNIVFWIILAFSLWFFFTTQYNFIKKIAFYLSVIFLFLSILSGYAGYSNYRQVTTKKTAIIITPTVNIKSSPNQNSATLYVLHSGTKIKIIEKIGSWYQIAIANGQKGWIDQNDIEKI